MRTKPIKQLTEADVKALWAAGKHTEIERARLDGRLSTLLGSDLPLDDKQTLTVADVKQLFAERRYAEIDQARADGRIRYDDTEDTA